MVLTNSFTITGRRLNHKTKRKASVVMNPGNKLKMFCNLF